MARRRVDESPEMKARREVEAAILGVLADRPDAITYSAVSALTGVRLDVLWVVSRDLEARGLIAIDPLIQAGTIFSLTPDAAAARRRAQKEAYERHLAEKRA